MATSPVSLDALVRRLTALPADAVDVPTVTSILTERVLDESSVRPFVRFDEDHYTRHLVHRDELFDVIVLCWRPGQRTPIHNHSGQLGWVRLVRGAIEEQRYAHAAGGPLPDLEAIDVDDDGVGRGVELVGTGADTVTETGAVVSVDRERAIHRLGHAGEGARDDPAVTLHVYSRPHDACLVFDPDGGTCWRRRLAFDSRPGRRGE